MRSVDQVQRLTQLVPYLMNHPGVSISETAEAFGVTPATVLKDLGVIQFCGLPGGLPDDLFEVDIDQVRKEGEIWIGNAEVLARPMTLTTMQAVTLLLALDTLVALGSEAARSAHEKLSRACGQLNPGIQVQVLAGDPVIRQRLAAAAEQGRVVVITHRRRDGEHRVEVEPVRLTVCDGVTYLEAWSRPRQAWRSFRLERILGCRETGEVFHPRQDLPAEGVGWFQDATGELTLEVDASAGWVTEHHPTTRIETTRDGFSITLPIGSRDWAVGLLLRLGKAVRGVDDPSLAAEAATAAREALTHYGTPVQDQQGIKTGNDVGYDGES
ncbi:WYL domain-containing protein [Arachnia propionica]|uniref:WYL domain-containing protein n=1 Tax=Arachnia propionica TaxID=1750 RepID=A0A3P1T8V9_9ACTN|nr:WYL domain-containing protein [Arachnia propionica]MDO5083432.1 WYL domain-containing protein [Arachnia propionica]RRD04873.1 WYL domain-containing protein [Arachnia propionica]